MNHQSQQENMIYLVVWGLLFAAPLLSMYVRTVSDPYIAFDWTEVFLVWRKFGVFLLVFLVHNHLLAPLLVYEHKRLIYFSLVAVAFAGFTLYQCNSRPDIKEHASYQTMPPKELGHKPEPPKKLGHKPEPPKEFGHRPPADFDNQPPRKFLHESPPPFVGEHEILAVLVLMLMFGANLGTKYYFRSRSDRKRLVELEKQNLEQQLEYLRYQINPHFFMNTLNNIHALVDIDPAKAQETIVELSKMMRFLLYEGDKNKVPLGREFDFLRTYVKLMQLRYTDNVRITLDLPTEVPDKAIPPLMLISFVENAFKHGVSYQHESFIDVKAEVGENRLSFVCRNSKAGNQETGESKKGGVGLANVRKRLNLLYDNSYTLKIQNAPDIYTVELVIPFINGNQ